MVRVKPPPSGRALPRKRGSDQTRNSSPPLLIFPPYPKWPRTWNEHQTREAKAKKWKGGPGRNYGRKGVRWVVRLEEAEDERREADICVPGLNVPTLNFSLFWYCSDKGGSQMKNHVTNRRPGCNRWQSDRMVVR
jgi:hypothetical protein